MSQSSSSDKSEKASPQKLRKARREGQVARSRDVGTAIGLLASFSLLVMMAPALLTDFRRVWSLLLLASLDEESLRSALLATLLLGAKAVTPWLLVPLSVVLASMVPGGWVFSSKSLKPKLERLDPIKNLKRLVSGKHFIQLGGTVLKVAAVAAVLWRQVSANRDSFARLQGVPLNEALRGGAMLLIQSVAVLAAVLVALAFLDAMVQRFSFMREQRMTKQEVKDEHKENEGRPEVKGRMRQLRRQMMRQGIRKAVPGADVVIVNPTHYAVALRYDEKRAGAPFVVAKGVDDVAAFIRQVAQEHRVEVLELPPLARAIYHTSQINQQIPSALYRAVAQVLAHVLQIKAFRKGLRAHRPDRLSRLDVPESLASPRPS